jgi:hypothetical protein
MIKKLVRSIQVGNLKEVPYLPSIQFLLLITIELVYSSKRGFANDFPVFYQASDFARHFNNPWDASFDPVYSAFNNGPLTALIISPLSNLTEFYALLLTRILSLLLIPYLCVQFSRFLFPKGEINLKDKNIWLASSIVTLTFPIRANLEYGQFYLIFAALALTALNYSRSQSNPKLMASGFLIGICCDYKPQGFLILALLICFTNKKIFFGAFLSIVLGSFISTIFTKEFPYSVWYKVISSRKNGGFFTPDQMNIYFLSTPLSNVAVAIPLVICFSIYVYLSKARLQHLRSNPIDFMVLFFAFTILFPHMHAQDLVFYGLVVVTIAFKLERLSYLGAFSLGSLVIWSNNLWVIVGINIILLVLLGFKFGYPLLMNIRALTCLLSPSIIFFLTVKALPDSEHMQRKYWGFLAILSSLLYCILFLKSLQSEKSENSSVDGSIYRSQL